LKRISRKARRHGDVGEYQETGSAGPIRTDERRPEPALSFRSFALPEFWQCYEVLPAKVQALADQKFSLFNSNPFHPSLALKQKGEV